jgi:hypothetical protein
MKLKVGMRVRIKPDIPVGENSGSGHSQYFNSDMKIYLGKVVTIKYVANRGGCDNSIKEDDGSWSWHEDWFEPIIPVDMTDDEAFKAFVKQEISEEIYKIILKKNEKKDSVD